MTLAWEDLHDELPGAVVFPSELKLLKNLKLDKSHDLEDLVDVGAIRPIFLDQFRGLGVYEAMGNSCYAGFEVTFGDVLDKVVSHPGEICTSFELLVAPVEKAVVSLIEDFVALVEVNDFVLKLGQIEVVF